MWPIDRMVLHRVDEGRDAIPIDGVTFVGVLARDRVANEPGEDDDVIHTLQCLIGETGIANVALHEFVLRNAQIRPGTALVLVDELIQAADVPTLSQEMARDH